MTELLGIARFRFHDGMVDEYKRLSERCMQVVREQDSGTLQYEITFNADESEAIVIERYRDSDALIEHMEHIGDELLQAVLATAHVEGETIGVASERLLEYMAGTEVRFFTPWLSLTAQMLEGDVVPPR
jgi:quinol monooxygenase YgiN